MNYVESARQRLRSHLDARGLTVSPGQFDAYSVILLVKGSGTTLEDVHHGWAVDRNHDRPEHPDLIPFEGLDRETRAYDEPFWNAILGAADDLEEES